MARKHTWLLLSRPFGIARPTSWTTSPSAPVSLAKRKGRVMRPFD